MKTFHFSRLSLVSAVLLSRTLKKTAHAVSETLPFHLHIISYYTEIIQMVPGLFCIAVTVFQEKCFEVNQISRSVVSDSLQPHESQDARPPCPSPTPGVHSDSCPSSQWSMTTIQPSHPLSSPSPPAPNPSQHQSLFQWVNSLHEVAKVLEFQL